MDYQVNVAKFETKADHRPSYYHYFTATGIGLYAAVATFDDLVEKYPSPAFSVTLQRVSTTITEINAEELREELLPR